jgi:hypothetical protein
LTDSNNVQPDEILVQKAEKKISLRFKKLDAAIVEIKILGHLASKFYHKNMDKLKLFGIQIMVYLQISTSVCLVVIFNALT